MAIVDVVIQNRVATVADDIELVCNNHTDTLKFTFDDEWNAYPVKTARFSWPNNYIDIPFSGDMVQVPEICNLSYVFVGVYTEDLTSTPAKVKCKKSVLCIGPLERNPPNNPFYEEFIERIEASESAVNRFAEEESTRAEDWETLRTDAIEATNAANQAATAANNAEKSRADAEAERISNENKRESAEALRVTAESNRASAEQARETAEAARATAEGLRVEADEERATEHETAIQAAREATQAAQDAAGNLADMVEDCKKTVIDSLCPPLEASGNPVQCYPVAGYPLSVKASFAPVQAGTGDPSPDNIRPISGRDAVQVKRQGKNLLPMEATEGLVSNGITWRFANGILHAAGTASPTSRFMICEALTLYPGTYTANVTDGIVLELIKDGAVFGQYYGTKNAIIIESTITVKVNLFVQNGKTVNTDCFVQIEGGAVQSPYEPYREGDTLTLALPETIYGGEVDAATGEGLETWNLITLDGSVSGNYNSDHNTIYIRVDERPIVGTYIGISSHVKKVDGSSTGYVRLEAYEIPNVTTFSEFQSFCAAQAAGTPVTIAYKLADPIPFQATGGAQLPALAGCNTLLTDGDGLTVTGRADPVHIISTLSDRVAALETAATI